MYLFLQIVFRRVLALAKYIVVILLYDLYISTKMFFHWCKFPFRNILQRNSFILLK